MTPAQIRDKLKRAREMEEVMAAVLLDITHPEFFTSSIPGNQQKEILNMLLSIKQDTFRHKMIVEKALETLKDSK